MLEDQNLLQNINQQQNLKQSIDAKIAITRVSRYVCFKTNSDVLHIAGNIRAVNLTLSRLFSPIFHSLSSSP